MKEELLASIIGNSPVIIPVRDTITEHCAELSAGISQLSELLSALHDTGQKESVRVWTHRHWYLRGRPCEHTSSIHAIKQHKKNRKNRGIQANRGSKKEEKMKGREMREKPPCIPHEKCFSELSKIINDSGRYVQPFIKRCNYECFKKIRTTSVLEWLKTRSLIVFIQRTQWRNKTIPNNYDYNSTIKLLCSGKSLLKLNQVIKQTDSQE